MCSNKRTTVLVVIAAAVLMMSACLFSPDSKPSGDSDFYSPADSAWKVVANLELAYQTKNLDEYMNCLDSEFEFMLLETDWDDYDGDGLIDESWGIDVEEQFTGNMFSSPEADVIELTLTGDNESVWYGDSTGTTLQLVRSFELMVYYYDGAEQKGYRAAGDAMFLCKPNEDGEYKIWQWWDLSEI
jgi:hypothetical protein